MQEGQQPGQQPNQPGWVFKPGDGSQQSAELPPISDAPPSQPAAPAPEPTAAAPTPVTESEQSYQPPVSIPDPDQVDEPDFDNDMSDQVEWTASEYIANPKNAGWYVLLAIGSVIIAALTYLITKEVMPTVVIGLLGVIVGIFAARQPQTLHYAIDKKGIYIGDKHYPYASFKAFSIAQEQAIGFIQLLPLKRFMPPIVIHYAPEDEEKIAYTLADYLPYEEHKADMVDSLTRRLRF